MFCIRSVGLDEQRALDPSACEHLPRPLAETPCNRYITCPSTWGVGNWSQVSAEVKRDLPLVLPLPGILTVWYLKWEGAWEAFLGQHCSQSLGGQGFLGML